jgi:hypothetical protein
MRYNLPSRAGNDAATTRTPATLNPHLSLRRHRKPLSVKNTARGRQGMIAALKRRARAAGGARVVLVYEASGRGFGRHDELIHAGIECYLLAPTKIARLPPDASERRRRSPLPSAAALRDFRRHDSGVRWEKKTASGGKTPAAEARCVLGAPSTWLSLVRLRPRRA